MKRKVIVVTDGDKVARRTVEVATRNIGGRCISMSWGNPTSLTGDQLVALIRKAAHDPVVVMLDDRGEAGTGKGEEALLYLQNHPEIELLGVVAVASNTKGTESVEVEASVTANGQIVEGAVDKNGAQLFGGSLALSGDTVEILDRLDVPVVIGTGDTGKMMGADSFRKGAPITTKALEEVLTRAMAQNHN